MIGTNITPASNIADMYMSVLAPLSVDGRLGLISKRSSSIKNELHLAGEGEDLRTLICGEWGDADELREAACTGRDVINW